MAPPPRPPIICYDLQTNTNSRRAPGTRPRVPVTCATRKTKVTVVPREPNDISRFAASACWYSENLDPEHVDENVENIPVGAQATLFQERKQTIFNSNDVYVRAATRSRPRPELAAAEPYQFNKSPFIRQPINDQHLYQQQHHNYQQYEQTNRFNNNNLRHAYAKKLRHEAEEKQRRLEFKRQQLAMQNQLEEISAQLESAKRVQENLLKTFGMSHNTAKYIQKQDEDFAKLRQKVDQFAETRSRELGRRVQQMKRFHKLQVIEDKKAEDKRVRDMSELTHCKRTLSSTLNNSQGSSSQTTSNSNNTESSSSTISISPCSSPMSIDDHHIPSIHFVESPPSSTKRSKPQPPLKTAPSLTSSTPSKNFLHRDISSNKLVSHKPADFTFYKRNPLENETIEVTDMEYFEKVEDETMIEVNGLMRRMQTDLKYINQVLES